MKMLVGGNVSARTPRFSGPQATPLADPAGVPTDAIRAGGLGEECPSQEGRIHRLNPSLGVENHSYLEQTGTSTPRLDL